MQTPHDLLFKIFYARLIELDKYLPLSSVLSAAKKMDPKGLNGILLRSVLNLWGKKPTYRDGILQEGPTGRYAIFLSAWKLWRQSMKEEHLPKIPNEQKPTVPVLSGIKREEHPPRHPTLTRAALESAI